MMPSSFVFNQHREIDKSWKGWKWRREEKMEFCNWAGEAEKHQPHGPATVAATATAIPDLA